MPIHAYAARAAGAPLEPFDYEPGPLGPRDVEVAVSHCGICDFCIAGDEPFCAANQATCVGHFGGYADRLRVDGRFAFHIPPPLSSEQAAPLLCGGATVHTPLRHFGVRPDHRVGVVGMAASATWRCSSPGPSAARDARLRGPPRDRQPYRNHADDGGQHRPRPAACQPGALPHRPHPLTGEAIAPRRGTSVLC